MKIFLASYLEFHNKSEDGIRVPKVIVDKNQILSNLKRCIKNFGSGIVIANNPSAEYNEDNDSRCKALFDSLEMSGINFKNRILLDERNILQAKNLVSNADFIFLAGGRIMSAMDFYRSINLKNLLKDFNGTILGISAGAMALCENGFDYPETMDDLFLPYEFCGLGLVKNLTLIPHYDGSTNRYMGEAERDVVNESLLPYSERKPLIGISNDSYILIEEKHVKSYGDSYLIKNRKTTKIQLDLTID